MLARIRLNERLINYSFWLALLLHILFFLSVTVMYVPATQENKHTPDYVPAYTPAYTVSKSVPAYQPTSVSKAEPQKAEKSDTPKESEKPAAKKTETSEEARKMFLNENTWFSGKSIMKSSKKIIQANQTAETMHDLKNIEPMLMIGDSSETSDPIIQILARALSAHFKYPQMEDVFHVTGRVVVAMVLHPEGNFTNVRIVESSNNQNFDTAALYAVNSAPPAAGADRFLKEPKYFVVGFVFGRDPKFQ